MVTHRMSHVPPEPEPWQPNAWMSDAACTSVGPTAFYPELPDRATSADRRAKHDLEAKAVAVCRACPVQAECLAYALEHDERYGIWGGTTALERTGKRWLR